MTRIRRRGPRRSALSAAVLVALSCWAGGLFGAGGAQASEAQAAVCPAPRSPAALAKVWHSPCAEPAEGPESLKLPLPVPGAVMAFRPVATPGREIFSRCAPEGRALIFGDAQDPFAGEQRRAVTGAFRGPEGWRSYLATYELSVGQAAAILAGEVENGAPGRLEDGLSRLAELAARSDAIADGYRGLAAAVANGAEPSMEALRELARPAAGLSPGQFDALAERFSAWCYRNGPCAEELRRRASFEGVPGFIRLPSELEWEYAARGGANSARFAAPLAVERSALRRHAVLGGFDRGGAPGRAVIGVGRAPTLGGFYDLYGNVSELTVDYFSSEYGSGKYGGRAARGGSFLTPQDVVSSGIREEAPLHRFDPKDGAYLGAYQSESLGARFAIGAVVKPTEAFVREARAAARSERCAEAAGDADPLGERLRGLATTLAANVDDVALRRRLERDTEETRRALTARTENLCRILAANMTELARDQVAVWLQYYDTVRILRKVSAIDVADEPEFYSNLSADYEEQKETFRTLAEEYFSKYVGALRSMSEHGRSCYVDGFGHARRELAVRGPSKRRVKGEAGEFSEAEAIEAASRHAFESWLDAATVESWLDEFSALGARLSGETPEIISR